jgi:hypothetical protein
VNRQPTGIFLRAGYGVGSQYQKPSSCPNYRCILPQCWTEQQSTVRRADAPKHYLREDIRRDFPSQEDLVDHCPSLRRSPRSLPEVKASTNITVPIMSKTLLKGDRKAGSRTQDRFHSIKWARVVIAREYVHRRSRISVLRFAVGPMLAPIKEVHRTGSA